MLNLQNMAITINKVLGHSFRPSEQIFDQCHFISHSFIHNNGDSTQESRSTYVVVTIRLRPIY